MSESSREDKTLQVALRATSLLSGIGIDTGLIGAMALAVHGYSRATEDADLGTAVDSLAGLREALRVLKGDGFDAELNMPDADDPLGGVITISGDDFDNVQIVNFRNPLRPSMVTPGPEAIEKAVPVPVTGGTLRVVDLPHLIALKLYSGGNKSTLDVSELLARNRTADRAAIRAVCGKFGLAESLDRLRQQIGESE